MRVCDVCRKPIPLTERIDIAQRDYADDGLTTVTVIKDMEFCSLTCVSTWVSAELAKEPAG
jgi:hypothetical protein